VKTSSTWKGICTKLEVAGSQREKADLANLFLLAVLCDERVEELLYLAGAGNRGLWLGSERFDKGREVARQ
jgi:hypothetical protein